MAKSQLAPSGIPRLRHGYPRRHVRPSHPPSHQNRRLNRHHGKQKTIYHQVRRPHTKLTVEFNARTEDWLDMIWVFTRGGWGLMCRDNVSAAGHVGLES